MAPEAIDTRPRRVIRMIGRVAREHAVSIGVLAGCFILLMLSRSDRGLAYVNRLPSVYSTAFSVGLFALILPLRFVALSVPLAAGLVFWFGWVNNLKMSAVALPVTFLDARLLITRPEIVFNALGITLPSAQEVEALIAAVAVLGAALLIWRLLKSRDLADRGAAFRRRTAIV